MCTAGCAALQLSPCLPRTRVADIARRPDGMGGGGERIGPAAYSLAIRMRELLHRGWPRSSERTTSTRQQRESAERGEDKGRRLRHGRSTPSTAAERWRRLQPVAGDQGNIQAVDDAIAVAVPAPKCCVLVCNQ